MANVIIDIEIVIDTQRVLNTYGRTPGTWDHPTGIAHSYGYMVAQSDYVRSGQATGDLAIKAIEGDAIRLRSLSLSGNANQSAVIYAITKFSGDTVTDDIKATVSSPKTPIPNVKDGHVVLPPSFVVKQQDAFYLGANIARSGTENYKVGFYITEQDRDGNTNVKGYYEWDPAIYVA